MFVRADFLLLYTSGVALRSTCGQQDWADRWRETSRMIRSEDPLWRYCSDGLPSMKVSTSSVVSWLFPFVSACAKLWRCASKISSRDRVPFPSALAIAMTSCIECLGMSEPSSADHQARDLASFPFRRIRKVDPLAQSKFWKVVSRDVSALGPPCHRAVIKAAGNPALARFIDKSARKF